MFDALTISLVAPPEANRRRMVILFTDGRDDSSFTDAESLLEVATRSQMAVFTVAVADGTLRRPGRAPQEAVFTALADATGGTAVVMQRDEIWPARSCARSTLSARATCCVTPMRARANGAGTPSPCG